MKAQIRAKTRTRGCDWAAVRMKKGTAGDLVAEDALIPSSKNRCLSFIQIHKK
jgi:hypothetical protein